MLYLFLFLLLFLPADTVAQNPNDGVGHTMIVEAHRDFEIYVAEVNITNTSESIKADIPKDLVFGYTSSHFHMMKIDNGHGGFEPINLNHEGRVKIYNSDTIKYVWENCNYPKDPLGCAYRNNHFVLITDVTITDEQITIASRLYDSDMQILSQGIVTKTVTKKLVPQQKTRTDSQKNANPPFSANVPVAPCNSANGSCPTRIGMTVPSSPNISQSTITEDQPPIIINIPPRLLTSQFHQVSLRVWSGVRYKI